MSLAETFDKLGAFAEEHQTAVLSSGTAAIVVSIGLLAWTLTPDAGAESMSLSNGTDGDGDNDGWETVTGSIDVPFTHPVTTPMTTTLMTTTTTTTTTTTSTTTTTQRPQTTPPDWPTWKCGARATPVKYMEKYENAQRIMGGQNYTIDKSPWTVLVHRMDGDSMTTRNGSGAIISPNWIVTGASVVDMGKNRDHERLASSGQLEIGYRSDNRSQLIMVGVKQCLVHDGWYSSRDKCIHEYNVAVCETKERLKLQLGQAWHICLPGAKYNKSPSPGDFGEFTGWGFYKWKDGQGGHVDYGERPDNLQGVSGKYSRQEAEGCTQFRADLHGCYEDNGAPFFCPRTYHQDSRSFLYGIFAAAYFSENKWCQSESSFSSSLAWSSWISDKTGIPLATE